MNNKEEVLKWLKSEKDSAKAALNTELCFEQQERLTRVVDAIDKAAKRIRQRKTSFDVIEVLNDCYQ